jgi:hypothetical protein
VGDDAAPQISDIEGPAGGGGSHDRLGRRRPVNLWRPNDPAESPLRQRAGRQGLGLMAISAMVSVLLLCGAWMMFRGR